MKTILSLFLLAFSVGTRAQDTGQFEISKTDFKNLFNNYRYASPETVPWSGNFFPYADHGTAVKLNKAGNMQTNGRSPIEAYALLSGDSEEVEEWEKEVHGCDQYDAETKKSCEDWWGHCNGWAAAAIKEKEPRVPKAVGQQTLSVAEQKGILTEMWLSSFSINAGLTDKSIKTGRWVHDHERMGEAYWSFWDVTPRSFFLIFTNYVGVLKTGIVIDRFTGDEVWNQPVVGYRLLPIHKEDISEVRDGNRKYWSVRMGIKIYWANDLDIGHGHISKVFDIKKMSDDYELDELTSDYEGRYLGFRLNFDSKVTVSSDGTKVLTAGKMIGDGLWDHQEESRSYSYDDLNHSHPDFIWLPTEAFQDSNGYGNPYIDSQVVQKMVEGREVRSAVKKPVILRLSFSSKLFDDPTPVGAKKKVQSIIRREGVKHAIYLRDIEIGSKKVVVVVRFPLGVDKKSLISLFKAAAMPVKLE